MMTRIFLISLFSFFCFFSSYSQAVVVKECPQEISVQYGQIDLDDFSINAEGDQSGEFFDGWNDHGLLRSLEILQEYPEITMNLTLHTARSAVCTYRGEFDSKSVEAKIEGSFRPGAVKKARLVAYWRGIVFYSNLESMSPTSIQPLRPFSGIYYNGEWCSYGDCIPDHIRIGIARSTFLSVKTN